MTEKQRAQELAAAHWDGYTGPMLEAAGVEKNTLELCKVLYEKAGVHFYGHAVEDCRAGIFPTVPLPGSARYADCGSYKPVKS